MADLQDLFPASDTIEELDLRYMNEERRPKNDKIALVDADTLVYISCLNAETRQEHLGQAWHSKKEWEAIISDPTYDAKTNSTFTSDFELCKQYALEKLEKILALTGCQTYQLHFTGGRNSFRYILYPEYKANRRDTRLPLYLKELKEHFVENDNAYMHDAVEADDIVVYLKNRDPDKYILCCVDKDVYNSVEGEHFNYYESLQHAKGMSWVVTEAEDARLWRFKQAVIGDPTDNIKGVKGIGPAKVKNWIRGIDPYTELLDCYEKHGRSALEAKTNLLLVTCGSPAIVDRYLSVKGLVL